MVSTNAQGLRMIELQTMLTSRQYTFAAQGSMDISPNIDHFTYLSATFPIVRFGLNLTIGIVAETYVKWSIERSPYVFGVGIEKHMKIAQTAEPPSIIHAVDTDGLEAFSIRTPKATTNCKFNAFDGTVIPQAAQ